jgi:hypothetical protein
MIQLPAQSTLDGAAAWIKQSIDAASVEQLTDSWREHLGGSVIGTPCERELWYAFRWIAMEQFDGRMLRLFQRGHDEEANFIHWLNAIGIYVTDVDPATGKQFRVSGHKGHFGGSLDGMAYLDPKIFPGFPPWVLCEFKTYATGPFQRLEKERVRKWRPKHYAQMCTYGRKRDLQLALYMGGNKNDDSLYVEFVILDQRLGDEWEAKAARIVDAQLPPPKIALSIEHKDCKYCGANQVCHNGAQYLQNCRSCANLFAVDGGRWHCVKHDKILEPDVIPKPWPCWQPIGWGAP